MDENKTVSVIIRTLDGRLDFLERNLFSLYCDYYHDKQAVLVYQGRDSEYLGKLENFKEVYPDLNIKIIQNPTDSDERARNLNLGIKNSDGRFICFLDDDDVVFPNHLSTLVGALQQFGRVWAYSQVCVDMEEKNGYVARKEYRYLREGFSFIDLWEKNYVPIISIMLDAYKLKGEPYLFFDEDINKYEDWAFLLKLAYRHEPCRCPAVTHIYKIRTDGSNTVLYCATDDEQLSRQKNIEWEKADAQIAEVKEDLASDIYWFREVMEASLDSRKERVSWYRRSVRPALVKLADSLVRSPRLKTGVRLIYRRIFYNS